MTRIPHGSPYPSYRFPAYADSIVATSHPLAAQVGVQALRQGGSAVDSAVAAAIMLTVVEPTGNGIGGDLFALVWDGSQLIGLNASGCSPGNLDAQKFLDAGAMPNLGWDSVTVPGAPSGWAALSERFGRLGLDTLAEPAARTAEEGWPVSALIAAAWRSAEPTYARFPDFANAFLPSGRAPRAGERFSLPTQAKTLRDIAATGAESLYRGELSERVSEAAAVAGAALNAEDLDRHRVEWVPPLRLPFQGYEIVELPPNGQGVGALWQLAALERIGAAEHAEEPDGVDAIHMQIEAAKAALALSEREVGDPAAMRISVDELLADQLLAKLAKSIDILRAGDPGYRRALRGGTVLVVAGDRDGRLCVLIQSNYSMFGSGIVIPETGIALQNRASGFSIHPKHANVVGPSKRPFHTIIPGMLLRGDRLLAGFGMVGGHLQAQGHGQLMYRRIAAAQDIQAVVDAPRWRVDGGRNVSLEHGLAPIAEALRDRGHQVSVAPPGLSNQMLGFGGAQFVEVGPSSWVASGDPRKEGAPVGW